MPSSTRSDTLLVELVTEELPPRALPALGESFANSVVKGLADAGLVAQTASQGTSSSPSQASLSIPASSPAPNTSSNTSSGTSSIGSPGASTWATPRRLGVTVPAVRDRADPRTVRTKGPSVTVGLDAAGNPGVALTKWALKQGVDLAREGLAALSRASDGKQECFFHERTIEGATLAASIEGIVSTALAQLPIPKRMNYQLADGTTTVSFVRPAHRFVVLHGDAVLPSSVLGLPAGRTSAGHRFLGDASIEIGHANDYENLLRDKGRVVTSFALRRRMIDEALEAEASALGARLGASEADLVKKAALLDEVTALVEWPKVLIGRFDEAFLAVPQECLILTMRTNQKYFPLFGEDGRLLARFLIVSNMPIEDPSRIIDGNERVVRPRLADAQFFYEQDRKARLDTRVPMLDKVVYHAQLGTQAQRTARIEALAGRIATELGQDAAMARRAAHLAKADLLTGMVGEFPELQGIMGRYYARHDGEADEVAQAIAEHYQPRFSGDALPASATGTVLALADKLETLTGIWGVGQHPSGDRDPFALRRHALGVVRILIEKPLPLSLTALLEQAFAGFAGLADAQTDKTATPRKDRKKPASFSADVAGLSAFIGERLKGYLREQRGFEPAGIDAVMAVDAERLDRLEARLLAVRRFRELPEAEALAAANKRIANILRKADEAGAPKDGGPARSGAGHAADAGLRIDASRLVEPAEIRLHDALGEVSARLAPLIAAEDYEATLLALASLREPVDAFFDQVMVNAEDPAVRVNRLALLANLHTQMNQVADLSRLG